MDQQGSSDSPGQSGSSQTPDSSGPAEANRQLRSTLAIGQLIAANKPTAGSRLIAAELRQLNISIERESNLIRREIANLTVGVTTAIKSLSEDARELRTPPGVLMNRRQIFGPPRRMFPVYRGRSGFRASQATQTGASSANSQAQPLAVAIRRVVSPASPSTNPAAAAAAPPALTAPAGPASPTAPTATTTNLPPPRPPNPTPRSPDSDSD